MSFANNVVKLVIKKPKITKQQSVLFIAPHPDDIEIGCGATVLKLISLGVKVSYLIATDGCYGTTDKSLEPKKLAEIRRQEQLSAAKFFGVQDVEFLDFSDGGNYDVYQLSLEISKCIARKKPDMIFCPDHKAVNELHIDHLKCGEACSNAFVLSQTTNIMSQYNLEPHLLKGIAYYYTSKPNTYLSVGKYMKKRWQGVLLHKSQFDMAVSEKAKEANAIKLYLSLRAFFFGILRFKGRAEGFRVLRAIETHCAG